MSNEVTVGGNFAIEALCTALESTQEYIANLNHWINTSRDSIEQYEQEKENCYIKIREIKAALILLKREDS